MGIYWSQSRQQFLNISQMNSVHIRNAMNVLHKRWLDNMTELEVVPGEFLKKLEAGPDDVTYSQLRSELERRESWDEGGIAESQ